MEMSREIIALGPDISMEFPPIPPMTSTDYSPPSGKGAAGAIVFVVVFLVIVFGLVVCARIARKAIVSELRAAVAPPPTLNVVRVWEIDAPTMERFLEELAKEKPVRFTAEQLCSFTSNYATRLGSGGFGIVYKGQFPNGVKIAVKVINRSSDKAAEQQFMAEVSTIGRTYHINLVRLYGFCYDHIMSALVYEYMENGSLDKYLFNDTQMIEWEKLHEIAIGTAKGITYLHEECQQRIIHYDIKPGNVLLDANFSPKVADFGLAKLCNRDNTHVSSAGYRGTPGYSAPEFLLKNYPITHKCDVYSFGMLLFEIVGRRRNTKVGTDESMDWFPKHVWDKFEKGELEAMTLLCGIEENNREKAERMAMVALWCVQDSPQERPPMSVVVKMLEGEMEVKPPPKPFHYLYSVVDVLNPPNSSDYTSNEGSNTHCYKDTTPIMAKHEIQMASSS
ncbi:rust resistance kinase Lr10-like isoform X1 [Camellia sinensis]|uniref:Protein kinase domain-containing protein n=1 Tax=Camellia sinensis var. sinensis TaxID=542762 RepID=A0A4V3WPW2_CAMSN|nr:rust resistance kinase Lr10-like isoform X1 [Camellia sinensis]THG17957.1 hypothetical protein TEA_021222 [Camellia sinensis var. sinensis]